MNESLSVAVEKLIAVINADYAWWFTKGGRDTNDVKEKMIKEFDESIEVIEGNKYVKIVKQNSVWGFIVKEDGGKFVAGDILKAAGWAAPAKNAARGNILKGGYKVNWTGPNYL